MSLSLSIYFNSRHRTNSDFCRIIISINYHRIILQHGSKEGRPSGYAHPRTSSLCL